MEKMLFVTSFFLSLMVCFTSSGWASAYDDNRTGEAAARAGDYDAAIRLFTKAIESGELSQEGLSRSYYNRGLVWFAQRDNDRAIADFTKAIAHNPKKAAAYHYRGNAWSLKGKYDRAIADFTKTIEIDPEDADAYYYRGLAWQLKGEYDKAIADYTEAIEIDPTHGYSWYRRAGMYAIKGEKDKALFDLEKAITFDTALKKEDVKKDENFRNLWDDEDFKKLTE